MRVCSTCKQVKPRDQFSKKTSRPDGLQTACKQCQSVYVKSHYERNKQYYVKKAKINKQKHFASNRRLLAEYLLTHPCVDCGERDPIVLEFDHVRGAKTESISVLAYSKQANRQKLLAEIAKCDVRCANCHRRKTSRQLGWYGYRQPSTVQFSGEA